MNKTKPDDDLRKRAAAWDKLEELREHPKLAYTDPGYDLAALRRDGDPYAWFLLLAEQPQLEKYFDWSRAETCPSVYWYRLLCRQPQFACHCDFSRWEGWQIRELLKKHPQFKTPELERLIEEAEIYEEYREEKDRDPVGDPGDLR